MMRIKVELPVCLSAVWHVFGLSLGGLGPAVVSDGRVLSTGGEERVMTVFNPSLAQACCPPHCPCGTKKKDELDRTLNPATEHKDDNTWEEGS